MTSHVSNHGYVFYYKSGFWDSEDILLSNMYGKIPRVVKARITRWPQARMQYCAVTTSGILPYVFDNVFIICLSSLCVKRNADSAVRCSSKSSVLV